MMGHIIQTRYRKGIMKQGPVTPIVAAATPTLVYQLSPGRTGVIRKLHIFNRAGANVDITIGDGAGVAFVQRIPMIHSINGFDLEMNEQDIQEYEFGAALDIYAQSTVAAAAPAEVQIQVTVEEFQGPTG